MNTSKMPFDVEKIRNDFPMLSSTVHGKPLAYLDNAATTQKPRQVIEVVKNYYEKECANVHRGVHYFSERATRDYEMAREKVQAFINAAESREIVFVRGTTEGINLVASTLGRRLSTGDEIVTTQMEHHSNLVPWQLLAEQRGISLKVVPLTPEGELDMKAFEEILSPRTRLVAVTHMSNVLGTINHLGKIGKMAHSVGALFLVDGAQGAPRLPVDVQAIDCDFYTFSGHKIYGPTGIGVLYGKAHLLEDMPPYQTGGEMIREVTLEHTTFAGIPYKFEAGTPHIAGAIGLGAAIDYICNIGIEILGAPEEEKGPSEYAPEPATGIPGLRKIAMKAIGQHEDILVRHAIEVLQGIKGLRLIGNPADRGGVVSFVIDGINPNDVGTVLDSEGIAVRTGHHCAMPVMAHYDIKATVRASFAFYNTPSEIDRLAEAVHKVSHIYG